MEPLGVSVQELLAHIGEREVTIAILRRRIAELTAQLEAAKATA